MPKMLNVIPLVWAVALPAQCITGYDIPTPGSHPFAIVSGPDGALWFTEWEGNKIGRVTTLGTFSEFDLPHPSSAPIWIKAGPDGALWFTEQGGNRIGRITTGGAIQEFSLPTPGSLPWDIGVGPDGAPDHHLWRVDRVRRAARSLGPHGRTGRSNLVHRIIGKPRGAHDHRGRHHPSVFEPYSGWRAGRNHRRTGWSALVYGVVRR